MVIVKIKERARRHGFSFKYAFEGLSYALREHPNFGVHLFIATFVLVAAYFFKITRVELLILILVIVLVLVTEIINSALEATVDLIMEEHHIKAKIAKDAMAAAVLVSAIGSIIVGLIIFIPYILNFF